MTCKDESAFPEIESGNGEYADSPVTWIGSKGGLTKREYFAAKALNSLAAMSSLHFDDNGVMDKFSMNKIKLVTKASVAYADALIEELERVPHLDGEVK